MKHVNKRLPRFTRSTANEKGQRRRCHMAKYSMNQILNFSQSNCVFPLILPLEWDKVKRKYVDRKSIATLMGAISVTAYEIISV